MKRIFSCVLSTLLILPLFAQNTLTIHQKDGQKFSYGFEESPVVSFADSVFVVKTTKVQVEYQIKLLHRFTFDSKETAIRIAKDDARKARITLDENYVGIIGAKPNTTVSIIGSDGKKLQSYKVNGDGTVSFSMENLPKGLYIVTSESLTVKIIKK